MPNRLQMLAFEAELAHLPRSLIMAIWEALEVIAGAGHYPYAEGPERFFPVVEAFLAGDQ